MEPRISKSGTICYTFLTTLIILLSKLRGRFCTTKGTAVLRFDRVTPWADYEGNTFMGCCDCGLGHFIIPGHSMVPERPLTYKYHARLGSKAWAEPDPELIDTAYWEAQKSEVI